MFLRIVVGVKLEIIEIVGFLKTLVSNSIRHGVDRIFQKKKNHKNLSFFKYCFKFHQNLEGLDFPKKKKMKNSGSVVFLKISEL